ncbi:hypothetical protein DFJ67_2388 [Asanoa ferruginea]|uniref:Uncharacterized protein n=1 Tax=Asanoa ferruginea TaxID=53367 RepID=A0A3D9ZHT9_9ACTN|nr:hypothetical protein [Asanoa ferruginea]REF96409.1 hypothetical protein DFJ67_2388 [Asanoa ferruginea]GIF47056.1 hypothetical protein Afe04nite_15950 [Asanoa ferruginea]
MGTSLALTAAIAAAALAAAALADLLPRATTAAVLRKRATRLQLLTGGLVAVLAGIGLAGLLGYGDLVPAVLPFAAPALAVGFVSLRRLGRVRRGAAAFATAPHTPAPPGLRAAAAHPLLALPIQVTALAGVAAVLAAAGLVALTVPAVLGVVLTAAGLVVTGIGVRDALRHSRLAEGAVARPERLTRPVGVLQV